VSCGGECLLLLVNDIIDQYEKVKGWENWPQLPTGGKSLEISEEYFRKGYRQQILEEIRLLEIKQLIYMEKKDWVEYGWDPIRVRYRMENVAGFYALADRVPKWQRLEEQCARAEQVRSQIQTPWILRWWEEKTVGIFKGRTLAEDEVPARELLYQCMIGLDHLEQEADEPMLIRVFSRRFLGNSKTFEKKCKAMVLHGARAQHPDVPEDKDAMDDVDVLEQLHLEMYSQELTLKGSLRLCLFDPDGTERILDTADYPYGLVLNQQTLSHVSICENQSIGRVLLIENKANFMAEPYEPGKLVIFTHGYITPMERKFLIGLREVLDRQQAISEHLQENATPVIYQHCGDLDFGGICIYRYLREKVFSQLTPYRMDIATYESCLAAGMAEAITEEMAEKLQKLAEDPQLGQLAARLAADRRVVEQEAYL